MRLYLIRHSKTYGNTLGRYIGTTDEDLCQEGVDLLERCHYPKAEAVYVSPLKRCIETAGILYPGKIMRAVSKLAECDFGTFENKSYQELNGDPDYQRWVDSGGTLPFPGGESQQQFRRRCVEGFQTLVEDAIQKRRDTAAVVVHGGTIMAVLEHFAVPHQEFYHWQVKNACGYEVTIDSERWKKGMREVSVMGRLSPAEE